jgi:dipeptidase E
MTFRGHLYLAGGGTPRQEENVWRAAFAGVRRVLYWPFALPDDRIPGAPDWFRAGLAELGIEVEVDPWSTLAGHDPAELAAADLVFVGGGTTSKLARHLREHGFDTALRDHLAAGGRYYGGSAGALLPCASIALAAPIDDDTDAALEPAGLGLVAHATVLPHANQFPLADQRRWSAELGERLLSIPEAGGVHLTRSACTVLGPDPVTAVDGPATTTFRPGDTVPEVYLLAS